LISVAQRLFIRKKRKGSFPHHTLPNTEVALGLGVEQILHSLTINLHIADLGAEEEGRRRRGRGGEAEEGQRRRGRGRS